MKKEATLDDFWNREAFLIQYLESQIEKKQKTADMFNTFEHYSACNAYKDILFKLTKNAH